MSDPIVYNDSQILHDVHDSVNHAITVAISGGGSGGTQYTEGATTSPATGNVMFGRYNATLPTLTEGKLVPPQLDSNGRQLVNIAAASPDTDGFSIGDAAVPATRANVLASGTPQATGSAILAAHTSQAASFSVSSVSTGTVYDVGNYASVQVQVSAVSTGSPLIIFQVSDDNVNWVATTLDPSPAGTLVSSTSATGAWYGALAGRYFRLNFTGTFTSGNTTGNIVFSTKSIPYTNNFSNQAGTWNTSIIATPTVTTVSVGTSSTSVLSSNSSRKAVIFTNVGANNIYLNLAGGTAVATNTLVGPGSTLVWDRFISTTAITGIAATGATNLSVTEMA